MVKKCKYMEYCNVPKETGVCGKCSDDDESKMKCDHRYVLESKLNSKFANGFSSGLILFLVIYAISELAKYFRGI